MDGELVIFVDHPEVDPRKQDNPICVQTCPIRGRFQDERCPQLPVATLREAILLGYTKRRDEAFYPGDWLEAWVVVCYGLNVCLRPNSRKPHGESASR